MNILLDTCTWIWVLFSSDKLSNTTKELYNDQQNNFFVSAISFWEITNKRKKFPYEFASHKFLLEATENAGLSILDLSAQDSEPLEKLPEIHKDPFDRILICQAINNNMSIATPDEKILQYPIKTIW